MNGAGADPHDPAGARDPIEALLDEYLTARRHGDTLDLDAHVARAGARAEELRELIESATMLDDMKGRRPRGLSLHTPQVLGDYRILAEIGRGGMGVVYEAEQITLGRRVAVKVLPPQALRSESRLARFRREAQTAAKLHHSNIVPVFGVGEQDGVHYYVMQLIVGRALDEVMRALRGEKVEGPSVRRGSGSMALSASSAAEALRAGAFVPKAELQDVGAGDAAYYRSVATLGLQVAEALAYAHAQGTLHRDIKPANLILDAHGVLWITDFGLAKVIEDESVTHSGDLVGTLQYMAPEQIVGHADERTDVHGLGLVLYELATLQSAFAGDSRGELVERVRNQEPVPAGRVRPGVPRDLETIIRKATAKSPGHRYQTAAELRDDLERFLQDRPIRARRVSTIESGWRWCRRNRLLAGVGAVAVLGLASTAVVGVVGYASTKRALDQAVAATKLAEDNVSLALAGFESVFARVVGPDMLRADDDEEGDVVAPGVASVLSANEQELLVEILHVYDQLAESNRGNAAARQLTARAYQRVGEIHLQLGKPTEAVANYERSVNLYEDLVHDGVASLGTLMQIENGLCRALDLAYRRARFGGGARSEEGAEQRERAETLASSVLERGRTASAPTPLMRFECARAHELLAQLRGRRGGAGRREGQHETARDPRELAFEAQASRAEHYGAALALYEGLLAEEPGNASYRHATARACQLVGRDLVWWSARDPSRKDEVAKLQQRAIDLLDALVQQFPHRAQYREALVTALTMQPPVFRAGSWFEGWSEPIAATKEQAERHKRAVDVKATLVDDAGSAAEFCDTALTAARLLLGHDEAEARAMAKRAVAMAEKYAAASDEAAVRALRVHVASAAAGIMLHGDPNAALALARSAAAGVATPGERGSDPRRALSPGQVRLRLAQVLWRTGHGDDAVNLYREIKAASEGPEGLFVRLTAAEELLQTGAAPAARAELAEVEARLERTQPREHEGGARGRGGAGVPGFAGPAAGIWARVLGMYERLSKTEGATPEERARDRDRAAELRRLIERPRRGS